MSGSGNSGYEPPQGAKFDCETGQIKTQISSIDIEVLKKQDIGIVLKVELNYYGILIVEDGNGEILGSILHTNTLDIIECIKKGHTYEAHIVQKTALTCIVVVKRK